MTPEFAAKLATRLSAYRHWALGRQFSSVRLVQYCGVEMIGSRDIALSEVEQQISGCTGKALASSGPSKKSGSISAYGSRGIHRALRLIGPESSLNQV